MVWSILGWTAALVAALLLILSWAVYCIAFRATKERGRGGFVMPDDDQYGPLRAKTEILYEKLKNRPFETVSIRSDGGLTLYGRYYHQADTAPVDIMMHGYRSSALRDFCGGFDLAWESGHNILLVDQRAHNRSEGRTISFGVQERLDCAAWARFIAQRVGPQVPVLLFGISMGAATVLMASALKLPENVRGIVADCPYSSPKAILCKVCGEDMHLPARVIWPLMVLGARLFGGFDPASSAAVTAVRRSRVPLLLIHGEADRFVPCAMSVEICHAAEDAGVPVRLLTVPNAGHGVSYLVDAEAYRGAVKAFMQRVLGSEADNGSCG